MSVRDRFNEEPPQRLLGIEVLDVGDGRTTGRLEHRPEICFDTGDGEVVHGGIVFALADGVGAAAATAASDRRTVFTVDMRIDYLDVATDDLMAEAAVLRSGTDTSLVEVEVYQDDLIALARGVYG